MTKSKFLRSSCVCGLVTLGIALAVVLSFPVAPASAHRSGCHRWHSCPSDHATYRWHGLLCVKSTADERSSAYRKRVVYQGLVYYCKR
jgi:hypothetical protein